MTIEFWLSILLPIAINYGMLRQAVKDLRDDLNEIKLDRKELEERVRELEIAQGPGIAKSFAAQSGK